MATPAHTLSYLDSYVRSKYITRSFGADGDGAMLEAQATSAYEGATTEMTGICFIRVIDASNLPKADWMSQSDPYVVILAADGRQLMRSQTRNNTNCPQWDELCSCNVTDESDFGVLIQTYDEDMLTSDDLLGTVEVLIKLSRFKTGETKKVSCQLTPVPREPPRRLCCFSFARRPRPADPAVINIEITVRSSSDESSRAPAAPRAGRSPALRTDR